MNKWRRLLTKKRMTAALGMLLRILFILSICYVILNPLLTKLSMSFMDKTDIYDRTVKLIPKHFTLTNYTDAIRFSNYFQAAGQTVGLCLLTTVLQVASCTAVGYGFARFRFRGRNLLFALVIVLMVVPTQILLTPQYLNFKSAGVIGSVAPFVLLGAMAVAPRCGLYIFLTRQFFRGIPAEIDEAAMIDGAGPYKVFGHIMLKSAMPIMVTIALFSFVWQWGENTYTPLFDSNVKTLASTLGGLGYNLEQSINSSGFSFVSMTDMAAYNTVIHATLIVLTVAPLILVYILAQRYFIESIESSGIVG